MILCTALLTPLLAFWLFKVVVMRKSDIETYKKLIKQRELASSSEKLPTNQHRKGVQKDIWFSQDDSCRLHYQIFSEASLLTLIPVRNHFEIVESLEGIRCWMQDKLLTDDWGKSPSQQARLIEAEKGVYRHTTQEFTADDVHLSLFQLPGHELPQSAQMDDKPFLSGIAHDISFLFSGKTPQFQANHFQASVVKE